jgi:hypothetical protein
LACGGTSIALRAAKIKAIWDELEGLKLSGFPSPLASDSTITKDGYLEGIGKEEEETAEAFAGRSRLESGN